MKIVGNDEVMSYAARLGASEVFAPELKGEEAAKNLDLWINHHVLLRKKSVQGAMKKLCKAYAAYLMKEDYVLTSLAEDPEKRKKLAENLVDEAYEEKDEDVYLLVCAFLEARKNRDAIALEKPESMNA